MVDESETLVGIVSRGDLLRVFLRRDDALRDEIAGDVLVRALGLAPSDVAVDVRAASSAAQSTARRLDSEPSTPTITGQPLDAFGVHQTRGLDDRPPRPRADRGSAHQLLGRHVVVRGPSPVRRAGDCGRPAGSGRAATVRSRSASEGKSGCGPA